MTVQHLPDPAPTASSAPGRHPDHSLQSTDVIALQRHFLAILPRIETHAKIYFCRVKCPDKRADLVAEVTAVCWRWYLRLVEQRREVNDFVSTLARFAARHVYCGRRLCGKEKAKDALSGVAQRKHGFTVQSLPEVESGVAENQTLDALKDNTRTPPPEQAAFRCDFPLWLASLQERKRLLAQDLMLGERTQDAARKHNVSQGRVSQVRSELLLSWRRFHGESD